MVPRTRLLLNTVLVAAALCALWQCGSVTARAGDADAVDLVTLRKVKAAYLLNFAKFIEWPSSVFTATDAPFKIGIVGSDSFGGILDETVKGRAVCGRRLVVQRLNWSSQDDRAAAAGCQILYVGDWNGSIAGTVASALGTRPVLLVGEGSDFSRVNGSIGFSVEGGRVVFSVDRRALALRQLKASSQLLKVARVIESAASQPAANP